MAASAYGASSQEISINKSINRSRPFRYTST